MKDEFVGMDKVRLVGMGVKSGVVEMVDNLLSEDGEIIGNVCEIVGELVGELDTLVGKVNELVGHGQRTWWRGWRSV